MSVDAPEFAVLLGSDFSGKSSALSELRVHSPTWRVVSTDRQFLDSRHGQIAVLRRTVAALLPAFGGGLCPAEGGRPSQKQDSRRRRRRPRRGRLVLLQDPGEVPPRGNPGPPDVHLVAFVSSTAPRDLPARLRGERLAPVW